jgi:PqqD family protein of HPr-rel-A system
LRRQIDGLALIYHRPSGRTHILSSPLPEILDAFAEGPADREALAARLLDQFAMAESGDAFAESLTARLDELVDMGLLLPERREDAEP